VETDADSVTRIFEHFMLKSVWNKSAPQFSVLRSPIVFLFIQIDFLMRLLLILYYKIMIITSNSTTVMEITYCSPSKICVMDF